MPLDWSDFTSSEDIETLVRRDRDRSEGNRVEDILAEENPQLPVQLTTEEYWANYCDEELYLLDKKVREYIKAMTYTARSRKGFKTSSSLVFAWIFGRSPTPRDSGVCRKLNRLLNYYAAEVKQHSSVNGKKVEKAYRFSTYGGQSKRPLSIKLRMELNEERTGYAVNAATFKRLESERPKQPAKRAQLQHDDGPGHGGCDAGRPDREDGGDEAR